MLETKKNEKLEQRKKNKSVIEKMSLKSRDHTLEKIGFLKEKETRPNTRPTDAVTVEQGQPVKMFAWFVPHAFPYSPQRSSQTTKLTTFENIAWTTSRRTDEKTDTPSFRDA